MEESALAESATELSDEKPDLSSWQDGCRQWREAIDAGQAGILTLPLAECVGAMEEIVNRR